MLFSDRSAKTDHPINPLIEARWSPCGFSDTALGPSELAALFEAARWAASSFNAQPWRYIVGRRGEQTFDRILGCLVPFNQGWARYAGALALGVVHTSFPHNGQPNTAAEHDLGAASASLTLEATARGIAVHQMSGLDAARAASEFALPEGFRVLTALAIGRPGQHPELGADFVARDQRPRERRPLSDTVFGGEWGTAAGFVTIAGTPTDFYGRGD